MGLANTVHGPAKGKSAKLNSHYGINSGGIVCFNKVAVMKEWSFLNANYIPALTAIRIPGLYHRRMGKTRIYERLHVSWYCLRSGPVGTIIQVQRIEGELFETKEQAEQHGVELCKEWIDKQKPEFNRRVG